MKEQKPLEAKCVYCGKVVFSFYKNQLDHNIMNHERWCKLKEETKSEKGLTLDKPEFIRDLKTGKRIRVK